jgi:hypothetical protein
MSHAPVSAPDFGMDNLFAIYEIHEIPGYLVAPSRDGYHNPGKERGQSESFPRSQA